MNNFESDMNATASVDTSVTGDISQEAPQGVSVAEPQVAPAPAPAGIVGLSEELRNSKVLGNFKDVDGLAKSYIHLNGLLGKKFDELSPSELDGFYTKLGRPTAAEEYSLPTQYNPEAMDWYKKQAFELGLTQQQARNLAESYAELESNYTREAQIRQEAQVNEWLSEIKQEFGAAFDQRVDVARKAVEEFGGAELKHYLNETGLGNHPAMVKAFAKIGKELSESGLAQSEVVAQFGHTPQEAMQRIAELKRDPAFQTAYGKASAPGHKEAVAEMQQWYKIAYPEG